MFFSLSGSNVSYLVFIIHLCFVTGLDNFMEYSICNRIMPGGGRGRGMGLMGLNPMCMRMLL